MDDMGDEEVVSDEDLADFDEGVFDEVVRVEAGRSDFSLIIYCR